MPSLANVETILEPGRAEKHYWRDVWHYRELFQVLAWRDVAVRYKQTVVGAAWVVIRPVVTAIVLTLVFGTIVLSVLYALLRRLPRRWWLWFWILALPIEVAAIFVIPVVIDPWFDHFSPLAKADPALVDQLERVAARAGEELHETFTFASASPPFCMPARLALDGIASCWMPFGVSTNVSELKNVTPRSRPRDGGRSHRGSRFLRN